MKRILIASVLALIVTFTAVQTVSAESLLGQIFGGGSGTINQLNVWKVVSGFLTPTNSSNGLKVPQLGGSGTKCLEVDNNGTFSKADDECGTSGTGTNYWSNTGVTTTLDTGSVAEAGSFVATSTTATSTFANALNVANHLYVGGLDFLSDNGFSATSNDIAHFFRSIDDYTAVILGNLSSGTSASSDLIFNNDATNDAGGYVVDIGYNSSNYDVIDYGLQNVPNMSYWYNTDGPISIATASTSPDAYIQFLTGGFNDEAMRIENTGNVTIGGIASEGYKLNVEGDVQFQNPDWTDAYIRMSAGAIAVKSSDNSLMSFSNVLTLSSNSTITLDTEEDITIRSGNAGGDFDIKLLPGIGNVGIGTTSPYAKLSVVGPVVAEYFHATSTTATSTFGDIIFNNAYGTILPLSDTAANLASIIPLRGERIYETDTTYTKIGDGTTTAGNLKPIANIYYTSGGNVGIGTTTPYAKLSVAGETVSSYFSATTSTATSTFAGNVTIGGPRIFASSNAFAAGLSASTRDSVTASGAGSAALGYVSSTFANSIITSSGQGSFVAGGIGSSPGGFMTASGVGAIALGSAAGGNTMLSSAIGSIAMGYAVSGKITSSGQGSFAGGRSGTGGITSSGQGSFFFGETGTSSANLATGFGKGFENSTANSFMVGYSSLPTLTVNASSTGIGTTTPGTMLAVGSSTQYVNISPYATSTFSSGINIKSGCFAINGTCVGGGSGSQTPWTSNIDGGTYTLTNVSQITASTYRGTGYGAIAPTYVYTSDTDTGFGGDNSGQINVWNNGAINWYFDANGRLNGSATGANAGIDTAASVTATNFVADSTTATSTFAGGLAVETSGLVYDYSTNNVGIGTTSPYSKLSVVGTTTAQNFVATSTTATSTFTSMTAGGSTGMFVSSAGTGKIAFGENAFDSTSAFTVNNAFVVQYGLNGSDWFSVNGGNVLFNGAGGTTRAGGVDLGARFNIAPISDSMPTLAVRGFSGGVSDIMRVSSPSVTTGDYFMIKADGKIGIGTSSPMSKLAVVGTITTNNINATSTTATSTFSGHLVQGSNIVSSYLYPSFTYATSTAWTGTTTIPLGVAFNGETWRAVKCFTDTGTVNVSINDGTNRMNMLNASTTVGNVTLNTNNQFTSSEKRYVDIGTPASSPTKLSCTVQKTLDVE